MVLKVTCNVSVCYSMISRAAGHRIDHICDQIHSANLLVDGFNPFSIPFNPFSIPYQIHSQYHTKFKAASQYLHSTLAGLTKPKSAFDMTSCVTNRLLRKIIKIYLLSFSNNSLTDASDKRNSITVNACYGLDFFIVRCHFSLIRVPQYV